MFKFELGQVVQMRSGGPLMTVEAVSDGYTCCVWFYAGDLKRHEFRTACLKVVD